MLPGIYTGEWNGFKILLSGYRFQTCDYTVVAAYKNRCKNTGIGCFQVKVDKFIPVIPLPDDTICELAEARFFSAQPEGGWWTLKDPAIPEAAEVLYTEREIVIFIRASDPYGKKISDWCIITGTGLVSPGYDEYADMAVTLCRSR